jgi:hypothetical protein
MGQVSMLRTTLPLWQKWQVWQIMLKLRQGVPEHQYIVPQISVAIHAGPQGFISSTFFKARTTVRSSCRFGVNPETFPKGFWAI